MSSPIKSKDKRKEPAQTKKKQLLKIFHQNIPFLQIFTPQEIDYLEDKLHIFVFSKGLILAKQTEPIDYLGIIAEGRAISKSRNYLIGDTIGAAQLIGSSQTHQESIVGESDGIVIAIRIYDLTILPRVSLSNKIVSYIASLHTSQLLEREDIGKQVSQFQTIEQKKISKYLTGPWSSFLNDIDLRQKNKFNSYFPFYKIKQKDLIMNCHLKPSLLYVVNGQIVVKNKKQQKIIQSGHLYNSQGFMLNQHITDNVYCLSAQAVVLVINKQILENNFKSETFNDIIKIVLKDLDVKYKKDQTKSQNRDQQEGIVWSIFKKHPDRQILPLPKKNTQQFQSPKLSKNTSQADKDKLPYVMFQTLFKEQLGIAEGKVKTVSSVAESNYDRLFSLKSQPKQKQSFSEGQLDKLRKEVQILTQKLKFAEQMGKDSKLDLIQNRSRLNMNDVFKQVRRLHQQEEGIHKIKASEGAMSESLLTFKEAFDKQIKENRIRQLVAKCAFKWLYLTRKNKANKKQS